MMVNMAGKDVCRLCLATDNLMWIFDTRLENSDNIKDVIYITTGVEISITDIISQKICQKCCQITIKMFEFRSTSLKNDRFLKDECKVLLKDQDIKIPNTQVTIRSEGRNSPAVVNGEKTNPKKNAIEVKKDPKRLYKIHPSVRQLFKVYPQIKLPTECLKYDIAPNVSMKMDQVEQYFKSRKLDFQKYTKLALRSGRVATKKTSALLKTKNSISSRAISPKILKTERKNKTEEKDVTPFKNKLPPASTSDYVHPGTVEDQQASNKRKFVEVDKSDKKETKKTNFAESLGLAPKAMDSTVSAPSYIANKSVPLHICEICNSVQYSAKELRKHQNKHLRCQFCKAKFRSLESKDQHLTSMCSIKNMMNHLPDVTLGRIEFNESVRSKYQDAFTDFPPLKSLAVQSGSGTTTCDINFSDVEPVETKNISVVPILPIATKSTDVIEILSDDEDSTPLVKPTDSALTSQNPVPNAPVFNVVYNTVSIVKPDIKIKGNSALDTIDARLTDIKVLKELLTHYRPVHLTAEKNVQTELPVNESICLNRADMSAELKLLKPQLHVYKIPIVMKNGFFNVSFNYTMEQKPPNKLCLWNDLNVIDIKPSNVKATIVAPVYKPVILPSTATYNSTGVISRPPQSTSSVISKFIRVNTSSLSPITTASYTAPSTIFVTKSAVISNTPQNTTDLDATTTTTQTSSTEAPVVSNGPQFGSIRVKNVWELT